MAKTTFVPKTTFVDGSFLDPSFMNTIYGSGTSGGHRHDGKNQDGSVRKVLLTGGSEVQGTLSLNNTPTIPLTKLTSAYNELKGYTMSNNSSDYYDLDVGPGICLDSTNSSQMYLSSSYTKKIDAAWSEGTGAGGFPSSGGSGLTLTDGTWYHVFAISTSVGVTDIGFDSNIDASVLLDGNNAGAGGYQYYRRIGSVYYVDSSTKIRKFKQIGDKFIWTNINIDLNAITPASKTYYTIGTPTGIQVCVDCNCIIQTTNPGRNTFYWFNGDSNSSQSIAMDTTMPTSESNWSSSQMVSLYTNTSSQIQAQQGLNSPTGYLYTVAYIDTRGKD